MFTRTTHCVNMTLKSGCGAGRAYRFVHCRVSYKSVVKASLSDERDEKGSYEDGDKENIAFGMFYAGA